MAAWAARFISVGAGKSGKPCARLTPPWRAHSRVISRMTDSVNCCALVEIFFRILITRREVYVPHFRIRKRFAPPGVLLLRLAHGISHGLRLLNSAAPWQSGRASSRIRD